MIPSKAATTSASRDTAWGFSILAITAACRADLGEHLADRTDVVWVLDEGERDEIHSEPQGEPQILLVLLAERRDVDRPAGKREALVVADLTAVHDTTDHVGSGGVEHLERQVPVVDEQAISGCAGRREGPGSRSRPARSEPGTSSVVTVTSAPADQSTGPEAKVPRRIFGPCRSARTAMERLVLAAASRTTRSSGRARRGCRGRSSAGRRPYLPGRERGSRPRRRSLGRACRRSSPGGSRVPRAKGCWLRRGAARADATGVASSTANATSSRARSLARSSERSLCGPVSWRGGIDERSGTRWPLPWSSALVGEAVVGRLGGQRPGLGRAEDRAGPPGAAPVCGAHCRTAYRALSALLVGHRLGGRNARGGAARLGVLIHERWFAELTRKLLQRSAHRSVTELEKDLKAWAAMWNEDPKPFVWRKTADQILESLGRYCATNSESGH